MNEQKQERERLKGKTIQSVEEIDGALTLFFTDGTVCQIEGWAEVSVCVTWRS